MSKLKWYSILIMALYLFGVLIYAYVFDFWETENHDVFLIGKVVSQVFFVLAMIFSFINGILIIKSAELNTSEKWFWGLINFTPLNMVITYCLLDVFLSL